MGDKLCHSVRPLWACDASHEQHTEDASSLVSGWEWK